MQPEHVPVMAEAVCRLALPMEDDRPTLDRVVVDATLGAAGHAEALLRAMGPTGRLLGIDRDTDALELAARRLAEFGDRARLVRGNFEDLGDIVSANGWDRTDAVIYDFGVSSMMLDRPERGFSYQHDAPLDMRMDPTEGLSARDVVNSYPERELTRVIRTHGEERWASRIAQFIVAERRRRPIETTYDLINVIKAAIPSAARRVGPHPARRTFQALRIEVNRELEQIETSLPQAVEVLSERGRLVCLSYHSLEDRIVKHFMRDEATSPSPRLRLISRKPQGPTDDELAVNPRASAARLRAAERLASPPVKPPSPGGHAA